MNFVRGTGTWNEAVREAWNGESPRACVRRGGGRRDS